VLLVDAANVMGSRPDGWWRDRPAAARALVTRIQSAVVAGRLEPPVVVVLEGQARRGVPEASDGDVRVLHADGSGDDALVRLAGQTARPVLVSADRGLAARMRAAGGKVVAPGWLLDRLATA
jgi:hypothetical protein